MDKIFDQIVKSNAEREEKILSKYACKSSQAVRLKPEKEDKDNIRTAFFHDTDRIIYSNAYTRYIDKTQVFFLFDNDHITHRVLHVQLVSKIARVIGRCLKLNEDLIEAISLGHDIGHVPYGHDGEKYLNNIFSRCHEGYFCHNAQSVRFLMELENKNKGFNLTLQTYDGILCHNGEILSSKYEPDWDKTPEKFMQEYINCFKVKDFSKTIRPMTLEGCLVRICDIVAYIGRDIEDAITVGLIKRSDIPDSAATILGNTNKAIIDTLVRDIIENSYGKSYIMISKEKYEALNELLEFNYKKIYENPKKTTENGKIKNMFELLFNDYMDQLNNNDDNSKIFKNYLKGESKEYIRKTSNVQIVLDFIAGMTDRYFDNEFKELVLPKRFGLHV